MDTTLNEGNSTHNRMSESELRHVFTSITSITERTMLLQLSLNDFVNNVQSITVTDLLQLGLNMSVISVNLQTDIPEAGAGCS